MWIVDPVIPGSGSRLTAHVTPRIVRVAFNDVAASGARGSVEMASRVATTTRTAAKATIRKEQREDGIDPAFHRAILKIALELKKHDAPSYDAIVERTIAAMRLDPKAFRRYLGENGARNMSLLLATARTLGA
jgi:hypothetical protein